MKFTSQNKQLTFDLFRSSLEELDKTNRWVMLGDLLPWAEIEKRYHLWNWIKWEKDGHSIPPIVVGSDDTGIFATNIYNEYANIYCKLVHIHGMSRSQAMDVIYKLDRNAQIYKFT